MVKPEHDLPSRVAVLEFSTDDLHDTVEKIDVRTQRLEKAQYVGFGIIACLQFFVPLLKGCHG